ncbi:hypothetical protein CY0110_16472 [Crocosphaera chwakensis CCY0110]|uniref:Uncharacterized protein n=1 Tax=Crocosphaera chwakensis CCY0110 TaxID=391612 RepID=A3IHX6_9CHRO|nr:hypothetical protein CY0110_16472 [Crocosphaera chwakensis CCY0110]
MNNIPSSATRSILGVLKPIMPLV